MQSRAQGHVDSEREMPFKLYTGTLVPLDRTLDNPDSHLSETCMIENNEKIHSVLSMPNTGACIARLFVDDERSKSWPYMILINHLSSYHYSLNPFRVI